MFEIHFVQALERSGRTFDLLYRSRNAMQLLVLKGRSGSTLCQHHHNRLPNAIRVDK